MEETAGIMIPTSQIQTISRCWVWLCHALTLCVNFANVFNFIALCFFPSSSHLHLQFFTVVIVKFYKLTELRI